MCALAVTKSTIIVDTVHTGKVNLHCHEEIWSCGDTAMWGYIAMWGYNYCHVGILSYGDIVVYRDLLT